MQRFYNSWRVRNHIVMVLRMNKHLKLAESIVSLHTRLRRPSTNIRTFLACILCSSPLVDNVQEDHFPLPQIFMPKDVHLSQLGDLQKSNYTILNTFKSYARRIWLFAGSPDLLNLLSVVNPTLTKIQLKTWTSFPTSTTLKTSHIRSLNHSHLLCRKRKSTPALAFPWSITLLSDGNATLWVGMRRIYKAIPTTRLRFVKSTDISSVGSRSKAWRRTLKTCWRKKTLLCLSQASKMGMVSRWWWLACQMIWLTGSGNYTLSSISDGITITNALSNTAVETSSNAWEGWCGSQPTPSISSTLLSAALTAICHPNTSIPKCTLWTGGGRHRIGEILQDNNVLIDV